MQRIPYCVSLVPCTQYAARYGSGDGDVSTVGGEMLVGAGVAVGVAVGGGVADGGNGEAVGVVQVDLLQALQARQPAAHPLADPGDFVQAAQAVQKTGKTRWGLAIRNSADSIIQYVYQNGGRLVTPDGKRPALSEPPAVEAFQWIVDLHKRGLAVPGVIAGSEDPIPLFASGQIPLFLAGGTFNVATLVSQVKSFKFGYTFSPQKVKNAILLGFQVITSFKRKDTDPQQVWNFMEFATRPENMVPVTDSGGNFPARLDARPKNYPRPDLIPLFIEASKYADEALNLDTLQPYWSATREQILRELGEAVSGQKAVKQATEAMDKALAAELAKS